MPHRITDEILLGFDAREMWLTAFRAERLAGGRPVDFLLRTDLDDVLSADRMVWPSLFTSVASLEPGPRIPQPQWIGPNVPFWEDFDSLENAIWETDLMIPVPFWSVAATWHSDIGFDRELETEGKILGPHISPTVPEYRDPAWLFLGFDVTDGGFISGLSNCGYRESERGPMSAEWGPHLNRYHLFDDLSMAYRFRTLTNARVQEHAPFFVIGLWKVAADLVEDRPQR
ncbi:MAG: hypothetical protein U0Q16_38270 [Bryobacteraceae bacterium]